MKEDILARILALKTAVLPALQKEYEAVFNGKKAPSNNKTYLWQRITYRIQELEYGGLPEEAQNKAKELAREYDPINNKALRPDNSTNKSCVSRDRRLPIPGTIITKTDGTNLDASALTSSDVSASSLTGLGTGVVADGAMQWGIPNTGLTF